MDISRHDRRFMPKMPVTSAPSAAANVAMDNVSSSFDTSYRRDESDTEMLSSRSRVFSSSCSAALCTVSVCCR